MRQMSQLTNRMRKKQSVRVGDEEGNVPTDSDKVQEK